MAKSKKAVFRGSISRSSAANGKVVSRSYSQSLLAHDFARRKPGRAVRARHEILVREDESSTSNTFPQDIQPEALFGPWEEDEGSQPYNGPSKNTNLVCYIFAFRQLNSNGLCSIGYRASFPIFRPFFTNFFVTRLSAWGSIDRAPCVVKSKPSIAAWSVLVHTLGVPRVYTGLIH